MAENELDTILMLRGFMALSKGTKPQQTVMAALGLMIMMGHEAGHDQASLINWFITRVTEGDTWNCFRREFIESAFNDPRMPKSQ